MSASALRPPHEQLGVGTGTAPLLDVLATLKPRRPIYRLQPPGRWLVVLLVLALAVGLGLPGGPALDHTPMPLAVHAIKPQQPVATSMPEAQVAPPPGTLSQAAQEEALRQKIESWRLAWASRDIEAYLAHYSAQFKPEKERGRRQWASQRRQVIGSRSGITLIVSALQLRRIDEHRWEARFLQDYASGSFSEKQKPKRLELVLEAGQWLIVSEQQPG